jgi:hypothetical protein
MTDGSPSIQPSNRAGLRAVAMATQRPLSFGDSYSCPACRHGQISAITLMDAFSCDFCRHIFTADLANQTVRVEDSTQPMVWRWVDHRWQDAYRGDAELSGAVWLVALTLSILPPGLVWLSSHTFPAVPGSVWAWFPLLWAGLAFLIHGGLVAWLLVEHYQLPGYVALKVRLSRRWNPR